MYTMVCEGATLLQYFYGDIKSLFLLLFVKSTGGVDGVNAGTFETTCNPPSSRNASSPCTFLLPSPTTEPNHNRFDTAAWSCAGKSTPECIAITINFDNVKECVEELTAVALFDVEAFPGTTSSVSSWPTVCFLVALEPCMFNNDISFVNACNCSRLFKCPFWLSFMSFIATSPCMAVVNVNNFCRLVSLGCGWSSGFSLLASSSSSSSLLAPLLSSSMVHSPLL
jgi:hypothetical protein